jgi:hypothetical protein
VRVTRAITLLNLVMRLVVHRQIGDDWALVLATHNRNVPLSYEGPFGPQSMSALGQKQA